MKAVENIDHPARSFAQRGFKIGQPDKITHHIATQGLALEGQKLALEQGGGAEFDWG